jgi:hypothetical protein
MNEAVERIVRANPVPGVNLADDDFVDSAALFSSIVSRREGMTDTRINKQEPEVAVRTPWYRHPALVTVSAAAAVAVVIGATALLFGGTDSPSAAPSPVTTTPTVAEAVTPTTVAEPAVPLPPPDPTAEGLVSIERVAVDYLNTVLDGGRIWDVTLGGPGLVAVGEVTTPDDEDSVWGGPSRDAFVLVSSDGQDWERVDDPDLFGGDDRQELHRVWGSSTGLIAQGIRAPLDATWYASADGTTWTLITDDDLYDAWERHYRFGETWFEFHEGGPGWVAALSRDIGQDPFDCDYPSQRCESPELQEVLVSSDGIAWEPTTDSLEDLIDAPTPLPATPDPEVDRLGGSSYPWNLARDQERVVGVRYQTEAMVGISSDGGDTWLRVDPERFTDEGQLTYSSFGGETGIWTIDVIRFNDMYVIVGDAYHAAGVWILEWKEQEDT